MCTGPRWSPGALAPGVHSLAPWENLCFLAVIS